MEQQKDLPLERRPPAYQPALSPDENKNIFQAWFEKGFNTVARPLKENHGTRRDAMTNEKSAGEVKPGQAARAAKMRVHAKNVNLSREQIWQGWQEKMEAEIARVEREAAKGKQIEADHLKLKNEFDKAPGPVLEEKN